MSNSVTPTIVCRRCKTPIDASDNYCRRCGTPTAGVLTGVAVWWESPWVVLPLLFVVLGPLALPLLWRSRQFTRPWKVALSVIVVAISVWAVWQVWYILNQALAPLRQLENLR